MESRISTVFLKDGDIVSLDAGTIYKGYHSDAARTWAVGNVSPEAQKLMDVTKQCFYEGIKFAKAGNHLNDISTAIRHTPKNSAMALSASWLDMELVPTFMKIRRSRTLRQREGGILYSRV